MNYYENIGMGVGKAHNILLKTILFDFAIKAGHKCYHCGKELTRETFSIEHIVPWRNSGNETELFFDMNNIAYSHKSCNSSNAIRPIKIYEHGDKRQYMHRGCRCTLCRKANSEYQKTKRSYQKLRNPTLA